MYYDKKDLFRGTIPQHSSRRAILWIASRFPLFEILLFAAST